MNKRQRLQAAWELEGDATIGAGAGFGKYTREVSELRRGKRVSRFQVSRVLLDSDAPMSEGLRRYQELEDELVAVRWRYAGNASDQEDRLLDEMNGVWGQLSESERDGLRGRPPRSQLRPRAAQPGMRALIEADLILGSHEAPRCLREVG
jgi:hypothetical protein